jgi:hypothetical protein
MSTIKIAVLVIVPEDHFAPSPGLEAAKAREV